MDLAAQLKDNLISRIKDSKDLNFLKALQTIFDSSEQALFELSKEQSQAIEIGRKEIAAGDFEKHDDVIAEFKTWLKSNLVSAGQTRARKCFGFLCTTKWKSQLQSKTP